MPAYTYAEIERYNFFRVPDWRWERVLALVNREGRPGRTSRRDDGWVKEARSFLLRWGKAQRPSDKVALKCENLGLFTAYDFYRRTEDDPEPAMYLQARILAGCTVQEVAAALDILPEGVAWYIKLYFDIVDKLPARDWIVRHIITPALARNVGVTQPAATTPATPPPRDYGIVSRPFLDGSLKFFAYFGGVHLIDFMLGGGLTKAGQLTGGAETANWCDGSWKMMIRRRSMQAAATFEVNRYNVMQLFELHSKIMELEQMDEAENRVRTGVERHIEALVAEIPWAIGAQTEAVIAGTILGRLDTYGAELRDDEVLQIAGGRAAPTLLLGVPEDLPPPRKVRTATLTGEPILLDPVEERDHGPE
jgi:hypothetical protein